MAAAVHEFIEAAHAGQALSRSGRPYRPSALRDLQGILEYHVATELGDVRLRDVRRLPGLGCVEATRQILAASPVAVLVLATSETDARVLATLRAGAAGLLLDDGEPVTLIRAVTRLGRGLDVTRTRRKQQPARKVPMLTPKVTEITRGCAHTPAATRIKPDAGSRQ